MPPTIELDPSFKSKYGILFEYEEKEYYSIRLAPGKYRIELWGAQGGHVSFEGGQGAYTAGTLSLDQYQTLYFYVGSAGEIDGSGGYNGGGDSSVKCTNQGFCAASYCGAGGGATDVRLVKGKWSESKSLKSRIMVAAGGGGCTNYQNPELREAPGSPGGALQALNGSYSECSSPNCASEADPIFLAVGGSQICGGYSNTEVSEGGLGYGGTVQGILKGGGGGGTASWSRFGTGSGGSSFISGYPGCHAFQSANDDSPSMISNIHYSKIVFTNSIMLGGNESIPSPSGNAENGHHGNGAAKITILGLSQICLTAKMFAKIKLVVISFLLIFVS